MNTDLFAANGFQCLEHLRTPALPQRYVPAQVDRPVGNDWQAIVGFAPQCNRTGCSAGER
jgi:hypothetical protein